MDGKRFTWQGEDRDRNKEKVDQLFVLSTHNMASQIVALFTKENCPIKIDNNVCDMSFQTMVHMRLFYLLTITEDDLMETKLWHEYQGSTPRSRTKCNAAVSLFRKGLENQIIWEIEASGTMLDSLLALRI
ncbi:5-3 exoribonuclease 3-like [Prunus yedoensis var. nudiflora]|uniref:5-3 exoribonuclease 3-like n=1 Tax=Prunus yedoensis var. nudiflora TaxID=2094558 RepID=A0A314UZE9_PRUYE|nr:5-3 exoribonuclease 3-like [Prunus yedoensis var. nudiflora]